MDNNLKASIEAIAELFGWSCRWDEEENLELENWSPAGEDLVYYAPAPDVIRSFVQSARDFDIDEHVEELIEAKHNGLAGVPRATVLVEDAKEIDEMLNDLADALETLGAAFKEGYSPIEYLYISDVRDVIEKREPKGLFITRDGEKYVGIDNRDGDAWTEEFDYAEDCIGWLYDKDEEVEDV